MDCSPSGFSVHGILKARILEWVAILFSRRSSLPKGWTWVSHIEGRFFTICTTREARNIPTISLPQWCQPEAVDLKKKTQVTSHSLHSQDRYCWAITSLSRLQGHPKIKNWRGLAPDERQRGKIMRRVACGSQRGLTGKVGTHGQLRSSSTLSFSGFSEGVSFQAPTLPSTQLSLSSSLSGRVNLAEHLFRNNLKWMLYTL